jgi:hypothetical protein
LPYGSAGLESPDRRDRRDLAHRAHRSEPTGSFAEEITMSPLRRYEILGALMGAFLITADPTAAKDERHSPGDPYPVPIRAFAGEVCTDDLFCSADTLEAGFVADGEFDPSNQRCGFVTTNNTIIVVNTVCATQSETAITGDDFPGPATRSFAWGLGSGDSWMGTWNVPGFTPKLYHLDGNFNVIGTFNFPDSGTGLDMQFSGLALDRDRGHLWGILRNNPAGTNARLVELDINVEPPLVIQGPIDVPWPGGPSAIGSAGLEYNNGDCTLLALHQDTNNVGATLLVSLQDVDPAGPASGVTLLGSCQITNTPCVGGGTTTNRPWGLALVDGPPSYVIFSDLNVQGDCATIDQPIDFHIVAGPQVTGQCLLPVTQSTWGQIKAGYSR